MLEGLIAAQQALLRREDQFSLPRWSERVIDAAQQLFRSDRIYLILPGAPAGRGSRSKSCWSVHSCLLGNDFERSLTNHFQGFDEDGFSLFRDEYASFLHRAIRQAGPGLFLDTPLYDPALREAMALQSSLFAPIGIERQLALSVPLPEGEAMLIAGYDEKSFNSLDETQLALLRALVEPFCAAMKFERALGGVQTEAIEALVPDLAFISMGFDGSVHFISEGLENELARISSEQEFMTALVAIARDFSAAMTGSADVLSVRSVACIELDGCVFDVRARLMDCLTFVEPQVQLQVARRGRLYIDLELAEEVGLTRRELEVAELIAQGKRDKEVARHLNISGHTARRHSESILKKTSLGNRAELRSFLFRS